MLEVSFSKYENNRWNRKTKTKTRQKKGLTQNYSERVRAKCCFSCCFCLFCAFNLVFSRSNTYTISLNFSSNLEVAFPIVSNKRGLYKSKQIVVNSKGGVHNPAKHLRWTLW